MRKNLKWSICFIFALLSVSLLAISGSSNTVIHGADLTAKPNELIVRLSGNAIIDDSVVYASSGDKLIISFNLNAEDVQNATNSPTFSPTSYYSANISGLQFILSVDGVNLNDKIQGSNDKYAFVILNCSELFAADIEGHFSISLTYNQGGLTTYTHEFHLVNIANYAFSHISKANVIPGQSSASYNSMYSFNTSMSDGLPSLSFNADYIELDIQKTYNGITYNQTISADSGRIKTSGDNIVLSKLSTGNIVNLVFKDLGEYSIKYSYYYGTGANRFALTNPYAKNVDYLTFEGYGLFYSNINSDNLLGEMKTVTDNGIVTLSSDISYLINSQSLTDLSARINNVIQDEHFILPKTNQVPVQLRGTSMISTESRLYEITNSEGTLTVGTASEMEDRYFYDKGMYALHVISESEYDPEPIEQFFVFEIDPSPANFSVFANIEGESPRTIYDGKYTNGTVTVSYEDSRSPYDAETMLLVEQQSFTGEVVATSQVDFSQTFINSGRYVVRFYYGKKSNVNGIITFANYDKMSFVIDNDAISGVSAYNAISIGSNAYSKGTQITSGSTNTNFLLTWNDKPSGASINAKFVYIPLVNNDRQYLTEFATSNIINTYNSYKALPVNSCLDYSGGTLSQYSYIKATGTITSNSVKTPNQAGLYIFHIIDEAGNEAYSSVLLDTTSPVVLQEVGGVLTLPSGINVASNDVTLRWGQKKLLGFSNIDLDEYVNNTYEGLDSLLLWYINQNYSNSKDGKITPYSLGNMETFGYTNNLFIQIAIDYNNVYRAFGDNAPTRLQAMEDNLTFLTDTDNDGIGDFANEGEWTYFIRDESNYLNVLSSSSVDNYLTYPSTKFRIKLSSDMSETEFIYTDNKGEENNLTLASPYAVSKDVSGEINYQKKELFYVPTTKSTLSNSSEILSVRFKKHATLDLDISRFSFVYYPYVMDQDNNYLRTSDTGTEYIVYDKNAGVDLTTLNGDYSYYEINLTYNSYIGQSQTPDGKYVFTREYESTSTEAGTLLNSIVRNYHDYEKRIITIIVDRNSIITTPVVLDAESGEIVSLVGGAIKMTVNDMDFTDIYVANSISQTSVTSILSTNKLPVKLHVPTKKYGYQNQNGQFEIVNDNMYKSSDTSMTLEGEGDINAYSLRTRVTYSVTGIIFNELVVDTNNQNGDNDNFLRTGDNDNFLRTGDGFTKAGYYKVEIMSLSSVLQNTQDFFTFYFRIVNQPPEFNLSTEDGRVLLSSLENGRTTFWTNQYSVAVDWSDSSNAYMAKIDREQIYYSLYDNNGVIIIRNQRITEINTIGSSYNFVLSVPEIYKSRTGQVEISMQYEEYMESSGMDTTHKTVKRIMIDRIAPDENISHLIANTTISAEALRDVGETYNISQKEGMFKYYSYIVDKSNLNSLIGTGSTNIGSGRYNIYYKLFSGKYNTGSVTEANYETILSSTEYAVLEPSSNLTHGNYYEIYEIDRAKNVTIYSIFYTDKGLSYSNYNENNKFVIHYDAKELPKSIELTQLNNSIDIFAKNTFSLVKYNAFGYDWGSIVVNGKTYYRSPFLTYGRVYDQDGNEVSFSSIANFTSADFINDITFNESVNAGSQYGSFSLKVTCLSRELDLIQQSTIFGGSQEGILIEVPSTTDGELALLFATSVKITSYSQNSFVGAVLLSFNDVHFLKSNDGELPLVNGFEIDYYNYGFINYLRIKVSYPVNNVTYLYEVTDNFETTQKVISLYGSINIETKPETAQTGGVVEVVQEGEIWLYSTKNVSFSFNYLKEFASITEFNSGGETTYWTENPQTYFGEGVQDNPIPPTYYAYIASEQRGMLTALESTNSLGGDKIYLVKIYGKRIGETIEECLLKTYNIRIYNTVPAINLINSSGTNMNGLFDNTLITSDTITLSFALNESAEIKNELSYSVLTNGVWSERQPLNDQDKFSEAATYRIYIGFGEPFNSIDHYVVKQFIIGDKSASFYQVVVNGEVKTPSNQDYEFVSGGVKKYYTQYLVNDENVAIILNQEQDLVSSTSVGNSANTILYRIYNTSSESQTISFFDKTIAVTYIAKTNNIINTFYYENENGNQTSLNPADTSSVFIVASENSLMSSLKLTYTGSYVSSANDIMVSAKFNGEDATNMSVSKNMNNANLLNLELKNSGTYELTFKDRAGNVQFFANGSEVLTIRFLKDVVFKVNDATPIPYATINGMARITIPASSIVTYDLQTIPAISGTRNGIPIQLDKDYTIDDTNPSGREYVFTKVGLYTINFTASAGRTTIRKEDYTFSIVKANESYWAYDFSGNEGYYIKKILKNNIDITSQLTNSSIGTLTYVNEKAYLKNLLLSYYDLQTGQGVYTLTIATQNETNQEYSFTVTINNAVPPVVVSIPENGTTTDNIKVTFNLANLLEMVGDCIVRITDYRKHQIDFTYSLEDYADGFPEENIELELVENGTFYVQVLTPSGRMLSSYVVTKTAPLNSFAIFMIIAGVAAVAGIITFYVVVRRKNKIR